VFVQAAAAGVVVVAVWRFTLAIQNIGHSTSEAIQPRFERRLCKYHTR